MHHVKDLFLKQIVIMQYIPSNGNLADTLIKAIDWHALLKRRLNLVCSSVSFNV